ncbi:MAG: hypothetical protein AAF327_22860, partial [Cyanobacteria bacterium P01_A01_bin.37]
FLKAIVWERVYLPSRKCCRSQAIFMQRFLCGDRPSFSTMLSLTLHHDRPSFRLCRFERLWNSRIVEWKIEAERFHQVLRIGTHMEPLGGGK